MDANRHNRTTEATEADDLIAELARLVAADARSTSAQSGAYARQEPQFDPDPVPVPDPEPELAPEPEPQTSIVETDIPVSQWQDEPQLDPVEPPAAPEFGYDDGSVAGDDADPIAGLIADAEVEAYARDTSDEDWDRAQSDEEWHHTQSVEPAVAPIPSFEHPVEDEPRYQEQAESPPSIDNDYPQESGERDPLSEIEALIGEAAQVNNGEPVVPGRRVRSSYLDGEPTHSAVDAAESAILAAAAASGASVHRVEPTMRSEPDRAPDADQEWQVAPSASEQNAYVPDPLFTAPEGSSTQRQDTYQDEYDDQDAPMADEPTARSTARIKRLIVPIGAAVVLFGLVGGMYVIFNSAPPEPGEAPVLTADATPIKEPGAPPDAPSASDSVVFNEIEGNTSPVEAEALVSRDQTGGATGREVASVLGPEDDEMALANRPVRTVTVRPDGTIVTAEDSVAGSNVLPVDRPDVPPVPNSTLTSDPIGAAIAEAMGGDLTAPDTTGALPATESALTVAEIADPAATLGAGPADDANATDAAATGLNAPLPLPRPEGAGTATGAATTPQAAPAVANADPAAATPVATGAAPAAWVQLASQRDEAAAQADMVTLQSRFGTLFGGAAPEVSRVDLGERGIYYRVRLPQPSISAANSVCSSIQAQGGDCFVIN